MTRPPPKRALLLGLFAFIALASVLAVLLLARLSAAPPARCAQGMQPLGARCCGEGQSLNESGQCSQTPTRCAQSLRLTPQGCVAQNHIVQLQGGTLKIGPGDWEAQGAVEAWSEILAPFAIDAFEVHEQRYAECEASKACAPLPKSGEPGRPITHITLEEAQRFCQWAKGSLPTRAQYAFAQGGERPRRYAWGDTGAVCRRAAFGLIAGPCGWNAEGPELSGSHPDGQSENGIFDLSGNVAEWTLPKAPGDASTEVRGGSYADSAASALRTWHRKVVSIHTRSPEIGFRCVYPPSR